MAEYVVAQAAVLIVPTLGKGPNSFDAKVRALVESTKVPDVEVLVKAETAKAMANIKAAKEFAEKDPIRLKVVVDPEDRRQLTEIRHNYEDLARDMKKGLFLNLKIAGLSLLPQLASGLAAVNASMVQLAQSALALPGLLAGVASSVGALATGLGGVAGAFKEMGEAQKNAAADGLKARNSALNVKNAYRDLGRTMKDAQRSLEDLNAELRGAPLDEADAIIRVQEAYAELADTSEKSALQRQKDALAVKRAENELVDTRLRNSRLVADAAEANAKGVAGSDAVMDASERLSKALDEVGTRADKAGAALKQLSPNAQQFVESVRGMSGEWDAFKNSVQDRLFEGLGAEVVKLGQNDLPILKQGFSDIAGELNGNLKTAMSALQTDNNKGFLERIFGNTANAQGNLDKAIIPLTDALLRLSAVGSDFLPRLADGLADVLTRFDNFIVRADSDGSLDEWINDGIDALKALGNSIINIGSMLSSLNDAFTGSGGKSFLDLVEQGTAKLAEFMKSADGQKKLMDFFVGVREELAQWRPLLDALPGLIANITDAASDWSKILLPFLTTATQTLKNFPGLVQTVFTAFLLWKTAVPVIKSMHNMIGSVSTALDKLRTKLLDHSGAQGHVGKFATTVGNAKTMVGELARSLGPTVLLTAVTTAVTYVGTKLAQAHNDAAEAARRQKDDLNDLVSSLDDVTGAAGRATNAVIGGQLRENINGATGQNQGDSSLFINDMQATAEAIKNGDLPAALAQVRGGVITPADVAGIDGGKFWDAKGKSLEDAGITQQTVADALNGNSDAIDKFTRWMQDERRKRNFFLPQGVSDGLDAVLPGESKAAPSLQDLQSQLPGDGAQRSAAAGRITEIERNLRQGGATARRNNEQDFGQVRLPADSPLAQFGVVEPPAINADGGSMITSSKPVDGSALADELSNAGVTFENFDDGKFKVSFTIDGANKYLEKYAAGGLISGPGSGTSDSILARLSSGEFVVNAASTQKHLPLLEQINGGALPAFAPGGPVVPKPPPTPPSSFLDLAKNPVKPTPSINSSGSTPGAGMRPGDFNRSEFQSAGQAQAARRGSGAYSTYGMSGGGVDSAAAAARDTPQPSTLGKAAGAVGNFFKGALGLGAPGYTETSTATLSTGNSAWNELRKPTAPAPASAPLVGKSDPVPNPLKYGIPSDAKSSRKPFPAATGNSVPKAPTGVQAPKVPSPVTPSKPSIPALAAESGYTGVQQHLSGAKPGPQSGLPAAAASVPSGFVPIAAPVPSGFVPIPVPAQVVEGVTPEVNFGAQEAAKYGLKVTSGLRAMETGSYHSTGQAGDYSNQVQYGPPTPEMNAFANEVIAKYAPYIDELIYAGVPQNIYKGQVVPAIDMEGSPYTTAQAQYHGDHVHIAWKRDALQQLQQAGLAGPQLQQLGIPGSPSNMPMANTPTGVQLPQLSYAPGAAGAGAPGGLLGGLTNQFKMPTPEEYFKYVSESWANTLQNLVKNAGQIAMQFLGSFFGLDLSGILGTTNSILGGFDSGSSDSEEEMNLPANADVDEILAGLGQVPPGYESAYLEAAKQNPAQVPAILQELEAMVQQQASGAAAQYKPGGGAEQWRSTVRSVLQQVAPKYGITNLDAWENDILGQIQLESNGNPRAENLNDTDGKGGTQQVFGLGQFLPATFNAHNVSGGDINDPVAQIYAMVDYLASPKYGVIPGGGVNWKGVGWRNGKGYATGGLVRKGGPADWEPWTNDEHYDYLGQEFGQEPDYLTGFKSGGEIRIGENSWFDRDPDLPNPDNFSPEAYNPMPYFNYSYPNQSALRNATGGPISGRGNGKSDSILARVSNGEFLVKASAAKKHMGLLQAINANVLPGFADGMMWPVNTPAPVTPPPVTTPTPPPSPVPPAPAGPQADAAAGNPTAPAPVAEKEGAGDPASTALQEIGSALGGIGSAVGGEGAEAPAGADPMGDPRSALGAAPQNLDHNKPAVSQGIQAAGAAISSAINTAVSAAAMGSNAMAPGSGQALGAASGMISGLVGAGAGAVSGAVNILSSLGVGTVTTNPNAGAYGTPLTPQGMGQEPYSGPTVVNNWNGGVHTSNNEEFYKIQQRRELQNASPFLPNR